MTLVSHRKRFIFLKTHKTAGTSVEVALEPLCAPNGAVTGEHYRAALEIRQRHKARRVLPGIKFGIGFRTIQVDDVSRDVGGYKACWFELFEIVQSIEKPIRIGNASSIGCQAFSNLIW